MHASLYLEDMITDHFVSGWRFDTLLCRETRVHFGFCTDEYSFSLRNLTEDSYEIDVRKFVDINPSM
jgi:hypothetical protein